ncbi:MAG TPA: hypothetical protein VFI82_07120 [Terriglobales bacterium]|nr:hypothetical protein [Terriglobales bacterium]
MDRSRLGALEVAVLFSLLVVGAYAQQPPFAYEPSLAKRISYSEIVCSATILKTEKMGRKELIGSAERDEFIAEAEVGRVFKGTLRSPSVRFRYYDFGPYPTPDHIAPPTAFFETGSRYLLFLKGDGQNLQVAVPVWQMEIRLAPRPSSAATSVSPSPAGIAEELFYSVRSKPKTLGRMATHYFSWAEEVIGKDAIPAVEPFLHSKDELVEYQAAWWLSFRQASDTVINVLANTKNSPSIEEWARSGATDRLRDMKNGLWLPPHRGEVRVNE